MILFSSVPETQEMGKINGATIDQPIDCSDGTSLTTDTPTAGRASPCLWLSGGYLHFLIRFFSLSEILPSGEVAAVTVNLFDCLRMEWGGLFSSSANRSAAKSSVLLQGYFRLRTLL